MAAIASSRLRPSRLRRPRWTLRLRLTLVYGAMFLLAGAVLLGITYELVAHSQGVKRQVTISQRPDRGSATPIGVPGPGGKGAAFFFNGKTRIVKPATMAQLRALAARANVELARQRSAQLDALLTRSGIALGIMAFVSIGLGWVVAGRALRPVRTMSTRARGISENNLHERLALAGPDDELKELGDTFDALLARLEAAFESQRRFVANASHELRTPITVSRALVEVALAEPEPSIQSLRETCERVLASGEQQERLIEALLTLARSQRGLSAREPLDLATIAREAVQDAEPNGVRIRSELREAPVSGDRALLARLLANLIDNALHYNERDGWVGVRTAVDERRTTLRVSNSGPLVRDEQVGTLLEPFRRIGAERTGEGRGLGLGLSIVAAIAAAHGAQLRVSPRAGGGLEVEVRFPVATKLGAAATNGATRGDGSNAGHTSLALA